jgi:hypothetical protein
VPRITTEQRRARLGRRHRLVQSAQGTDPAEAARSLIGYHATDPGSVYLQARARSRDMSAATLERALYDDRSLVRMIGMRRTLFAVPTELAPMVNAAATRAIAARERTRLVAMLGDSGIAAEPEAWLEKVEAATVDALRSHDGPVAATELSAEVAGLRERITFGEGREWVGAMSVATRLLMLLAMEGRIMRGRPRGTWISGQYRWAPTDRWLGGDMPQLATDDAQQELVRRWLRAFGPGTERDVAWWTGLTLGAIRRAVAGLDVMTVELDDGSGGLVLADDLAPEPPSDAWVALLPALDATTMGWTTRDWYLGRHGPVLFDTNGNAGPTIWVDGRVVGGWSQRRNGEVLVRLLEDPGRETRAAIEGEAAALGAWVGPVRVVPRFRTPLEQELAATG